MIIIRNIANTIKTITKSPQRQIWGYVAIAFNRVDADRLKLVGPNRTCAEWVLKNGGAVRFQNNPSVLFSNYNSLPGDMKLPIIEIDGTNSSIMDIGFDHLKNCDKIENIKLIKCKYLENGALEKLENVKSSLKYLEISGCFNINETGLMSLTGLTNLEKLVVSNLPYIKDFDKIEKELKEKLPRCSVHINEEEEVKIDEKN